MKVIQMFDRRDLDKCNAEPEKNEPTRRSVELYQRATADDELNLSELAPLSFYDEIGFNAFMGRLTKASARGRQRRWAR